MLDLLVFLAVIGGGGLLAFLSWVRFTNTAEEAAFQRQLEEIQREAVWTPQQQLAERDAVHRRAEQDLRRIRQERDAGHE